MDLGQVAVILACARGPCHEFRNHALQVRERIGRRGDGIVTEILGLRTRVDAHELLRQVAIREHPGRLAQHPLQHRALGRRRCSRAQHAVAPLDHEVVERSEAPDEVLWCQPVARLCDVVLSRVIHDRAGHTVLRREAARTQRIGRERCRRDHVVRQAERVPHFVRDHLRHRLTHHLLGNLERAYRRIRRTRLDHQPVAVRPHVVVVPRDVALDDFTRTRVGRARAHGVAYRRCSPPHDRVPDVLRVPVRILGLRWCILGLHGIPEAGTLEHCRPRVHAGAHVRTPLGRRGRIQVVHDRLHRLHQFTACVGRRILRLQAPAANERLGRGLLLVQSVVDAIDAEEADAIVRDARTHRHLRQQHQRLPHRERDRRGVNIGRRCACIERLRVRHLDIHREALDAIQRRARGVEATHLIRATLRRREARQRRRVAGEEFRHVQHV